MAWLLPAQVKPAPASDTRKPKFGLETTLIQGAGGITRSTSVPRSGLRPGCKARSTPLTPPLPGGGEKIWGDGSAALPDASAGSLAACTMMWYSRPSGVKPPKPLAKTRPGCAAVLSWFSLSACLLVSLSGSPSVLGRADGTRRPGNTGGRSGRSTWLASAPRLPASTTRAAAWRRTRSASLIRAALRTNTPPGLSASAWESLARTILCNSSNSSSW